MLTSPTRKKIQVGARGLRSQVRESDDSSTITKERLGGRIFLFPKGESQREGAVEGEEGAQGCTRS